MLIVGAGMAGLLAGLMLRRHSPTIIEAQPSLPHNHAAVLRFRTKRVSEATGIPFKEVTVRKGLFRRMGALRDTATLADSNEYSLKVTGEVMDRSVLNLEPATRYISPENFIEQMSKGLDIEYDMPFTNPQHRDSDHEPVISTIPMPVLMDLAGWENKPQFKWVPIWTATTVVESPPVNVYQTIYFPEVKLPYYRASLTGNRLAVEYIREPQIDKIDWDLHNAMDYFGVPMSKDNRLALNHVKRQEYGKLLPIPEPERKAFILAMTDRYNIWSVGRFATWRQLLLDDVVEDIRFVDRVLETRDTYSRHMHNHVS